MFTDVVLSLIFVACFVFLMNAGLWTNTLTLVNVLVAGLLAMNYFEPLAAWLDSQQPSLTYWCDFFAIWLIFAVAYSALRAVTDFASHVKVKFFLPVDRVGGIVMAAWVAWIMMGFATATLHTAPLARNFLGSFQNDPDTKMLFGLGPDRYWLGWVRRESLGPLCRFGQLVPFDPRGDYILRYGMRRQEFDNSPTLTAGKSK